ncbi:N-acetylmuramoyl-L-alanine amidase family protein [Caproiciproducens galactitolivorans]|uniref:N-acetylmuramoyl-L-alanine amidase n=1 Tax=Caproiciproducens galactitolivorans TaxID=642589 RepID=A0ABT4BTA8_9FIRM|nr:N-acetylmuramoyl-L-alanine amidase [Caproiciproducens galactitolivorans]MCY1714139.1 N-acetylmuramoyl-L-alanine amidase [Caproiciproducens galactitolivorans]
MKKEKRIGFSVLMLLIGCLFSGAVNFTPLCLSASGSGGAAKASGTYHSSIAPRAKAGKAFKVYLSPSCQTWNPYCDGSGNEEYHMRQIAAAMQPYLKQYGIESVLAAPQTGTYRTQKATITARAKQASDTNCDLYLSIHSNARDGGPKTNGTLILYPSNGSQSLRFAQILQSNFLYPDNNAVDFNTKDELWEMYMPKMPHCLIETAYHDNVQDVQWIQNNTDKIAKNLAYCVALYANVPTDAVQM